jgi:hypothetical protein
LNCEKLNEANILSVKLAGSTVLVVPEGHRF